MWSRVGPDIRDGPAFYGDGMRLGWIVLGTAAALATVLLTGCGSSSGPAAKVPDVTQQPLDAAADALEAKGLRYDTVGGGLFGIVVRSHWTVCRQAPRSGTLARHVTLYVARHCAEPVTRVVPGVVWLSLPEAEDELEDQGLRPHEESISGDPVVVQSRWTVCDQWPEPGAVVEDRWVTLYVAHDCFEEEN